MVKPKDNKVLEFHSVISDQFGDRSDSCWSCVTNKAVDLVYSSIQINLCIKQRTFDHKLNTTHLTHWGLVVHLSSTMRITRCGLVTYIGYTSIEWVIIGIGNGMLPERHQAITRTDADTLSIDYLGTNLGEIWTKL